ncbi:MAG: hypothetical protein WAX14_16425 [Rhodococcus sp. (in: high G+C Gram-positive bacteria)]|uniref:hypothetical protein n=1 Tax=Rhodococcus sp. TaxID=1831 RepID=UPI003BB4E6AF
MPAIFACATTLTLATTPAPDFAAALIAGVALIVVGIAWVVLAGIQTFRYHWDRRILVAPLVVTVTALVLTSGIPRTVGWAMTAGSLRAHAERCTDSDQPRQIGVYSVAQTRALPAGCVFLLDGGFLNTIGVAHLPDGPTSLGEDDVRGATAWTAIDNGWYRFILPF